MVHADELNACRSSVLTGNSAFDLTVELADHNGTALVGLRAPVWCPYARVWLCLRVLFVLHKGTHTRARVHTHTPLN